MKGGHMGLRFLRLGLFTCVLAVLFSVVMPRAARVHADDSAPRHHCVSHAVAYARYYADDTLVYEWGASDMLDTYEYDDFDSCQNAAQLLAINVARRSCAGVSTRGIAYSQPDWDIFWDDVFVYPVRQQYDCGDV